MEPNTEVRTASPIKPRTISFLRQPKFPRPTRTKPYERPTPKLTPRPLLPPPRPFRRVVATQASNELQDSRNSTAEEELGRAEEENGLHELQSSPSNLFAAIGNVRQGCPAWSYDDSSPVSDADSDSELPRTAGIHYSAGDYTFRLMKGMQPLPNIEGHQVHPASLERNSNIPKTLLGAVIDMPGNHAIRAAVGNFEAQDILQRFKKRVKEYNAVIPDIDIAELFIARIDSSEDLVEYLYLSPRPEHKHLEQVRSSLGTWGKVDCEHKNALAALEALSHFSYEDEESEILLRQFTYFIDDDHKLSVLLVSVEFSEGAYSVFEEDHVCGPVCKEIGLLSPAVAKLYESQ